jgi:hypothetical protein
VVTTAILMGSEWEDGDGLLVVKRADGVDLGGEP